MFVYGCSSLTSGDRLGGRATPTPSRGKNNTAGLLRFPPGRDVSRARLLRVDVLVGGLGVGWTAGWVCWRVGGRPGAGVAL